MYAVPVDVLSLFIWVWLVSLVCIIKLYLMLVLIKRLYEIVIIMTNLGYKCFQWYYDLHSFRCFVGGSYRSKRLHFVTSMHACVFIFFYM